MANDGMLSQEEIDALLNVDPLEDPSEESTDNKQYLTLIEEDTLGEIGNISFGSSATTLSTILNQKVEITTPEVSVVQNSDLKAEFKFEPVSIEVNYVDGFTGKNVFVIKASDAAIISDIMLGGDGTSPEKELNDIHLSAVQEAMNQMMGAAATSMSTIFNKKVDISPPAIKLEDPHDVKNAEAPFESNTFVKVSFQLKVGELIDSKIMQLMPINFAREMADQLLNGSSNEVTAATIEEQANTVEPMLTEELAEQPVITEAHVSDPRILGNGSDQGATIQQAAFSEFEQVKLNKNEKQNLDMLLDIPLKVTVELGRTKRTIKDILDLSSGSIIELDKLAGEPVDILVNEKLIAKGEVVVIDENFGVRVTDIMSQTDRLKKLK